MEILIKIPKILSRARGVFCVVYVKVYNIREDQIIDFTIKYTP